MEDSQAKAAEALGLSLLEVRLGRSRDLLDALFDKDPSLREVCRSYGEAALTRNRLRNDPEQADRLQIVELFCKKLDNEVRGRLGPQS
jgi:hypothetical protein